MMKNVRYTSIFVLVVLLSLGWLLAHFVGIRYGTKDLPLHQSYVGDEQSPVNGALHMLQEKSVLGLRNITTLYYGPIFAVIALPAVVGDFAYRCASEQVCSASAYKNFLLWDWGGVVIGIRILAVFMSALGLFFVYKIFNLETVNPKQSTYVPLLVTALVAVNFYYFEYSHFFKHWVVVLTALLGQVYFALRVFETRGVCVVHWFWHGVFTVVSFGVSYLSAIYMVAFLPMAVSLWRSGNRVLRKTMLYYAAGVAVAALCVVWWHPYALIRLLGVLGVGPMAGKFENSYTPFYHEETSFLYYGTLILINHLPIFLMLGVLGYKTLIKSLKDYFHWVWLFGSIALLNFLLFASLSHHEGRYMLPTIVMSLLLLGVIVAMNVESLLKNRSKCTALVLLLVLYAGFHGAHIAQWMSIYARGPAEHGILPELLSAQQSSETPVGLVQGYIFGHVHTKEAYTAYIEKRGRQDTNLYKAIIETPLPEGVEPLNVRYVWPQEYAPDQSTIDSYDVVYKLVTPREGEINQFDYMDENLLRLWRWDELMPRYERLK